MKPKLFINKRQVPDSSRDHGSSMVTIDWQTERRKVSGRKTSVPVPNLNKDSQKDGLNQKVN